MKLLPIALILALCAALCLALSGCTDKAITLRTPYGIIDTSTSGTTNLDLTPLFPPPPPPLPPALEK